MFFFPQFYRFPLIICCLNWRCSWFLISFIVFLYSLLDLKLLLYSWSTHRFRHTMASSNALLNVRTLCNHVNNPPSKKVRITTFLNKLLT